MRMLYSYNIATYLEERERKKDGLASALINAMLNTTMADRLWTPFQALAYNPAMAAVGLLVVYLVFCIVFTPLLLLSYLITWKGSCLFLLGLIFVGARSLARSIAFPGSTMSVQREMSADFMRRNLANLENVAKATATVSSTLMLVASGRIPRTDLSSVGRKLDELKHNTGSLRVMEPMHNPHPNANPNPNTGCLRVMEPSFLCITLTHTLTLPLTLTQVV